METKKSSTKRFDFDPKKHVYTLDGKPLHGVTTVLGVISKPALIQWAANEAVKHIADTLAADIQAGFDREYFDSVLSDARYAHRKKKEEAADAGTDVHALVEDYVNECSAQSGNAFVSTHTSTKYAAILPFLAWATSNNIRFLSTEKRMYSERMWVAGTCDLIFEKDGKTYVGDIKTYKKLWDRTPFLQCAAYSLMAEETEGTRFDGYCILRMKDGEFEEKWSFDVEGDREGFLAALKLYKTLQNYTA